MGLLGLVKELRQKKWFKQLQYWMGYGLFVGLIIYSVWQAPPEVWALQPFWLGITIFFIVLMLPLELAQLFVFLHHHKRPWRHDLFIPIRITTRKSVLNAILPAQTGTLLLLYMVTTTYKLKWHQYVRFVLVVAVLMLFISIVATVGLFLPTPLFVGLVGLILAGAWGLRRLGGDSYFQQTFWLLLTGSGIYLCRLFVFWTILHALNNGVSLGEASYFAIVTNTLAQIPLTPGNIGIREALFGVLSPYLSLPTAVGVLIGGIFQVLRVAVYALIMFIADAIHIRYYHGQPLIVTSQAPAE